MRISAKDGDPGFEAFCKINRTHEIKVFVDDVEIESAITADDVEGFVDRYLRDVDGLIVITRVTERLAGKVRIDLILRRTNG